MSERLNILKNFDNDQYKRIIDEGIEKNRKRSFTVKVNGCGEDDITVEVNQKTHEFRFGANIFMLDEFEEDWKNAEYRKKFPEIFNLATVPFYWSTLEPEEGRPRYAADSPKVYRRPAPDLCVDYCLENGIEPKCHCLNYDVFVPDWLDVKDINLHKAKLEKRFREISERYADKIPSFEVTNETLQNCKSAFFYEPDFVEWSFRTADRYFPDNRLVINDYNVWWPYSFNNRNAYYMQIERLMQNGIKHIDSVGMQFHSFFSREREPDMAWERYNPETLYKLMNTYAPLGLAEQITEMTIPAYSSESEDEYIQAELIKNVYRTFFSHPSMEAIIYWNLVDGYAFNAKPGDMTAGENQYHGGLLSFDMSEKPAYKELKRLVNEEWHTADTAKCVDGTAEFRGFCGDYEITVYAGDKCIKTDAAVSKNSENVITVNV